MIDMSRFFTTSDQFSITPAIMLALFACAILLFDFMFFPDPRQVYEEGFRLIRDGWARAA